MSDSDETADTIARTLPEPGEICRMAAVELGRLIAERRLSSVEVVSAFLDRIEAINPFFNAVISLRERVEILRDAREADERRLRGEKAGALLGLPIAIKDLAPTKGLTTTFGSPLFRNFVPDEDGYHVARIREAGAIIIGKTNVSEFGLGSNSYNTLFGSTRNAITRSRIAGGSSGGAAVALATNMVPIADGSDMGGSLRNPAAYNNIYGFRPSQGRVPSGPQAEGFLSQMATDGPLGRSVADLALLLEVQAGSLDDAPLTLEGSLRAELDACRMDGRPIRVAWLGDLGGHLPMDEGVTALCEQALALCEANGWEVEALVPEFDYEALWQAFVVLRQATGGASLAAHKADPQAWAMLKPEAQWEAEGAFRWNSLDILAASTVRTSWYRKVLELTERFDLLAIPSAQVFPYDLDIHWPKQIGDRVMDSYHRWMEVSAFATLAGSPAMSVPVGFDPLGRAMGMQLIGRPRADARVLKASAAYERFTPFGGGRFPDASRKVDQEN